MGMSAPNRNFLWTGIFVEELARCGLRAVCIAPGSRSTPLTMAFAAHPDITVYSHIDERSAAFFALGLALSSDQPVALVCSSGTATANFFPAIIEAHESGVPLLVLTADRPHELRGSGANQTIDQVKLYGDYALWSVDVAPPQAEPAPVTLRSLRTLACRAYDIANGSPHGPVHLNFPFRKPLEPTPSPDDDTHIPDAAAARPTAPFTRFARGVAMPTAAQLAELTDILSGAARGLFVCGPRCPGGAFAAAVTRLAEHCGFPVLADPLSNVRFGGGSNLILGGYDTFLRGAASWESPQVVLHFGAMPTSQTLDDYLTASAPDHRIRVSSDGLWTDANHQLSLFVVADPQTVCERLTESIAHLPLATDRAWVARFQAAEAGCWEVIGGAFNEAFFDGTVLADTVDVLPDGGLLYVANSLPVRQLDQFARPTSKHLRVFCNRGASGIDGTVSSALGAAAASEAPLVLVTGDLAFYHDLNGLLAFKRCGVKATIVVINNDGGGIFYRLPIAKFDPPFTDLFVTPHGLHFEPMAQMYGLHYEQVSDRLSFRRVLHAAMHSDSGTIIEVPTSTAHDDKRRRAIMQRVVERVGRGTATAASD
jgi:2-succinyl-5-enolpyruvyl-6-hydroxy-3-cyclohexene-1-carboxylate synthase